MSQDRIDLIRKICERFKDEEDEHKEDLIELEFEEDLP